MQQASWNLCPEGDEQDRVAFSRDCYFADDRTFDSLSGTFTRIFNDLPDGRWNLIMRRDVFHKTRGSIMDFSKVRKGS